MFLRNARQLEGCYLCARDGEIGVVHDFYFDEDDWHIRYCVIETGYWLQSRRVLISPVLMGTYDSVRRAFPVDLTMEQVRSSPDVDTTKPPDREYEEALRLHYGWPGYWDNVFSQGGLAAPVISTPPFAPAPEPELTDGDGPLRKPRDPYLRSVNDTFGYGIEATDGPIGHVDNFLIDDHQWGVRFLIVDTRNWWPGKQVLVERARIADIDWQSRQVKVDLTRAEIKNRPLYDPDKEWSEEDAAGGVRGKSDAHP